MHVKKDDLVKVVAGKDRALGPARVIKVFPKTNRVVVEGRNLVKKHLKARPGTQQVSQILETEAPLHASNVRLWSEKLGKPVRTQMRWVTPDGGIHPSLQAAVSAAGGREGVRKVRFCVKSEEIFD